MAWSRAVVVRGQIVVHFGSLNASDDDLAAERAQRDALAELVGQREAGSHGAQPGARVEIRIRRRRATPRTGLSPLLQSGRLAATAVPMPTPATSAIPKTVHCSRRDTSLQYAPR